MRNLKKLFAVVMVVAMLASMMVPALAAGVEYEDEATILQDLGLFQGYGAGELGLADDLTREQGLALMLRVMGLEDEVKAMTEEEVAAELARVVDPETVTATWAKPYVAYAVKNGLTKGIDASILPNVKFAGQLKMTGKEFINLMLNGMGYATAWDDVLTKAAEVEMLSAGESVTFGTVKEMTRDQAVAIMFGALSGITSEGITLAQALVDAGAVDADKMEEYGFIEEEEEPVVEPEELEATASTTNLVQINVEFSAEVDADSAKDKDNYEIEDGKVKNAELQDDGVTVVLTLEEGMEQQAVKTLTIKKVKDLNGEAIAETSLEVEFFDRDIPEVLDAEVVGNNTFKVIFSEPMKVVEKGEFVVNSGKMYVKSITMQNNNTEALVEMYSTLKEGEVTLQVKSGNEDYAGFGVIGRIFTLEVVPDEEAPVVIGYESAKRNKVTLVWNEDIKINFTTNADDELVNKDSLENFYHTNSKNPATKVTKDGNKLTLEFGDDKDNWLPAGTGYVYVLKNSVKDFWDNKNAQQMIKVEVELDEEAPVVDEIKVKDEHIIEVKFNEDLDSDSAEEDDNYTILDDKGKEKKNIIKSLDYKDKKVTIEFYEDLNGDHTLVIEDVEDIFGNKMPETAIAFTVGDETPPVPTDFSAVLYNKGTIKQMIKINFGEKMAVEGKYAVNDDEKYVINGKALEEYKDYEIKVVDDGEVVEIYIPTVDDKGNVINPAITVGATALEVARVADAAGNYTEDLTFFIDDFIGEGTIGFADKDGAPFVHATAVDTIKIKFTDNVAKFDINDILVSKLSDRDEAMKDVKDGVADSVYGMEIAGVETELDGGKTVVYITTGDDMPYYLDGSLYVHIIGDDSENAYGEKLSTAVSPEVLDKIAPKVDKAEAGKDVVFAATGNTITIKFTEDLDDTYEGRYAHDLVIVNRDGDTLVALDDYETTVSGDTITVTIKDVAENAVKGLDKYTIKSKDSVNYIKDLNGNTAESFKLVKN